MKKRILSFFLALCMVMVLLPVTEAEAAREMTWNGWTPISTAAQLKAITSDMSGKYYLTNDIELTGTWSSLGSVSNPFTGILDGNGYAIRNMTVSYSGYGRGYGRGLFAWNEGVIRNLTFDGCTVTGTSNYWSSTNVGRTYFGFVAGVNERNGQIINCVVQDNCTMTVKGNSELYVGGIAGISYGEIRHCQNQADLTVNSSQYYNAVSTGDGASQIFINYVLLGGIVGSGGNVSYCRNTGTITAGESAAYQGAWLNVGGIAGAGGGFSYCINRGAVTGIQGENANVHNYSEVGGIVGYLTGNVDHCENYGPVVSKSPQAYVGGIAGESLWGTIRYARSSASLTAYSRESNNATGRANVFMGGIAGRTQESEFFACFSDYNTAFYAYTDSAYFNNLICGYLIGDAIEADTVDQCYSVAYNRDLSQSYSNSWCTASLVGEAYGITITNTYYYNPNAWASIYFNGGDNSNGSKRITGSLTTQSTYSNFDFSTVWKMGSGTYNYPVFRVDSNHVHGLYTGVNSETGVGSCVNPSYIKYFTCSGCGDHFQDLNATKHISEEELKSYGPHSFGAYTSNGDATCTTDGTKTATCANCTETKTVTDVGSHTTAAHRAGSAVRENVVAGDCQTKASYDSVVYCSICKTHEISRETIEGEFGDHTPGEAVVENEQAGDCQTKATYESVVYCSLCKPHEMSRETIEGEFGDHTPGEAVVENEQAGDCLTKATYDSVVYCSLCKTHEISRETIEGELGDHTPGEAVVENEQAGDCQTKASYDSVVYCSLCKTHEISRETVEGELGDHRWSDWTGEGPVLTRECGICGETDEKENPDYVRVNPFVDVPEDSFFYEPVMWAVEKGITTGTTPTTYSPNDPCLRAQVVTFLWRAAGSPEPTSTNNPFTDVKEGDFFYKAVLWAVENGITNGISETAFGAYNNCNRAAVVTFLWRAAGCPEPKSTENPFVDVKDTDFFYKAVLWAVENSITNGVDDTHFAPGTDCNRAQVVTFLYRVYN